MGFLCKTGFRPMGFEQLLLRLWLFPFDSSCATSWFLYGDAVRIWARTAIRLHFLPDVDRCAAGYRRSWTGVTLCLLCGDAAPVNQNRLLTTQGYHTQKNTNTDTDTHTDTQTHTHTHTHTHTRLTALFLGLPRWAGTRKVKPIRILLKQETVSGSSISWSICKSAPFSRQITTPAPHHSGFYRPDALPATQPTASKHWRHYMFNKYQKINHTQKKTDKNSNKKFAIDFLIQAVKD